jgi:hypothetical protein
VNTLQWIGLVAGVIVVTAGLTLVTILTLAYRADQRSQTEQRRVDQLNNEPRCDLECCNPPREPLTPEELLSNDAFLKQILSTTNFAPGLQVVLPSGAIWVPNPEETNGNYSSEKVWRCLDCGCTWREKVYHMRTANGSSGFRDFEVCPSFSWMAVDPPKVGRSPGKDDNASQESS